MLFQLVVNVRGPLQFPPYQGSLLDVHTLHLGALWLPLPALRQPAGN